MLSSAYTFIFNQCHIFSFGKYLTLSKTSPGFICLQYMSFENDVGKRSLLITSNFSFSHVVFNPFGELFAIFINFEIVVCQHFQIGSIKNLSFGKGLTEMIKGKGPVEVDLS